jgi:four helix bundle protein
LRDYRNLRVWEKAHLLTLSVYKMTRGFPIDERFALTSQMRRAASSIGANLAEGCGRRSDGELARYINIAMGSGAELSYHCLLARDLAFLEKIEYETLNTELDEVMRMLSTLLSKVKKDTVAVGGFKPGAKS